MEDTQHFSPHSCEQSIDNKSSNKTVNEKFKKPFLNIGRRHRAGFFDKISPLDFKASLGADKERAVEEPPPTDGTLEDCSTSEEESIDSSMASVEIESAESEPVPDASTSSADFENQRHSSTSIHWRDFFRTRKKRQGVSSQGLPIKPKLTRRKKKRIKGDVVPQISSSLDAELSCFKCSWKNFSLSELREATDNFSRENLIGEGGYAEVYKGRLKDGKLVAIKRLTRGSPEEMTVDFLSELGIIVHVDHPNIAQLIGYGVDGGMHLVLQLSPHGSLASLLYGSKEKLNWCIRFKIALGAAEGLCYLHEGCQRRIIHKDIKPANILLSEDFDAQISDFGLSKWLTNQWTHHIVSKVEGTFGYLPPEFFLHGIVNEKTDVFAFGVVLLELVTGWQALDSSQKSLVMWANPLIRENKIEQLVDPSLGDDYDSYQLNRVLVLASICICPSEADRPRMSQVVDILKGNNSCQETLKQLEEGDTCEDLLEEDP